MLTVSVFMAWQGKTPLRALLTKSNVIISAKLIYPAQLNVGPGHGWDAVCMGVHGDGEAWRIIKIEIISPVVPLLSAVPRPDITSIFTVWVVCSGCCLVWTRLWKFSFLDNDYEMFYELDNKEAAVS